MAQFIWFRLILLFGVCAASLSTFMAAASAPTPPKLRLDDTARPLRYAAQLRVDPGAETFNGSIDIDLELKSSNDFLWLNGRDLVVKKTYFTVAGKKIPAKAVQSGQDFLGFRTDSAISAGPAQLHVQYQGRIDRKDSKGLFAQKEGGRWYAITKSEAIFARRIFPCFDEPNFKVPWQLTLNIPQRLEAVSNTPIISEKSEHPGFKTVAFAPTRPLPSYLVAFAVGPYAWVDAGRAGRHQVALRIAAPYGKKDEAKYAASMAGPVLEQLEAYFDSPYPYEKLDNVSIPLTSDFGAMENPGMVTYSQEILLANASNAGIQFQRSFVGTAVHEYAHQWFGDLVTPAFWDDIWLNESFASWMEGKILDAWKPEWTHQATFVRARARAMNRDVLKSARQIRQPIESNDDIFNAFDGITYSKGEAVLAMIENLVGAEIFRKGVQNHLRTHADGVTTSQDFIASISAAAGRDITPVFQSFLDQPGAPLIDVKLQCSPNRPATLQLHQQRFLPLGSPGGTSDQTWQVPLCVRWIQDGQTERGCTLLTAPTQNLSLGEKPGCPEWFLANDQELGYYRVSYEADAMKRLLSDGGRKHLTLPETLGVLDHVQALVNAGRLPLGEALGLVPDLATDKRRLVTRQIIQLIGGLEVELVSVEQRAAYASYIQKIYGERARALGWTGKEGEDEDTQILRASLVSLVAEEGLDKSLQDEARVLALQWLSNRKAISPDVASVLISTAARFGDEKLFQAFLSEARRAKDRDDRRQLLYALGNFRDPKLARAALDIVKGKTFDPRESLWIFYNVSNQRENRDLAWQFLKNNFDLLEKRLSPEQLADTPFLAPGCEDSTREDMEKFFQTRVAKLPGGPRNLAQSSEGMTVCKAYLMAQRPSVKAFFAAWR